MRTALVSLIAISAFATAAGAQQPTDSQAPAAPAATAPTETAPAPATPAAPAATAPTVAPVDPAAAPVAAAPVAEPPAEPAPPPPNLPTTGDGAAVLALLEKICVPVVRGQSLDQLAKSYGYKYNKREGGWIKPLGAVKTNVIVLFPTGANKGVCQAEVRFAFGQEAPIITALNIWSFLHQPELILQANYVAVDADGVKRVRKSWENLESNSSTAVNFTTERKPDDTPLNKRYDTGRLYYQERTF